MARGQKAPPASDSGGAEWPMAPRCAKYWTGANDDPLSRQQQRPVNRQRFDGWRKAFDTGWPLTPAIGGVGGLDRK